MSRICFGVLSAIVSCVVMSQPLAADDPAAAVGQLAPDFTATGIDGVEFTLAGKLEAGDKNIVLVFSRANW